MRVVIVNFRTPDLTIDCLHALAGEAAAVPGARVSVVDNASEDGSVQLVGHAVAARAWEERVTVVPQKINKGYAAGCNAVIRTALRETDPPDYFWLLNPDTRPQPGALAALMKLMQREPLAGLAGSHLLDEKGAVHACAFRFPTVWSELDAGLRLGFVSRLLETRRLVMPPTHEASRTDWVPGASMMVRREVLQTVGLLDEGFFLYFEDVDLCRRAQRHGWECWQVPESRVVHLHGRSAGVSERQRWWACITDYWLASRRLYWLKHHSRPHAALADACWLAGLALWRARRTLQHKPDTDPPGFLAAAMRHSTLAKGASNELEKSA